MANRTSGWMVSGEACPKGWHFNVLLLPGMGLFSCNWYRVRGQSAHPLQRVELVRAGTRDFQSSLHRAGISGLVAFIFLPCHRVSKTSRSFEKCLMMCRTNVLGSERSWRRLFVKKNHKNKKIPRWFSRVLSKSTHKQANRGQLGDINPCTLLLEVTHPFRSATWKAMSFVPAFHSGTGCQYITAGRWMPDFFNQKSGSMVDLYIKRSTIPQE